MTDAERERVAQIMALPDASERVLDMLARAVDQGWKMHRTYMADNLTMDMRNPYSGRPMWEAEGG